MIPKTAFMRKSENIAATASNDFYTNFKHKISQFYIHYLCIMRWVRMLTANGDSWFRLNCISCFDAATCKKWNKFEKVRSLVSSSDWATNMTHFPQIIYSARYFDDLKCVSLDVCINARCPSYSSSFGASCSIIYILPWNE